MSYNRGAPVASTTGGSARGARGKVVVEQRSISHGKHQSLIQEGTAHQRLHVVL